MPMSPVPAELQAFFRALPKVELHCHLLGAVRRQTFAELAFRPGSPVTAADVEAFYTRGDKPVGAIRVLRSLDVTDRRNGATGVRRAARRQCGR